MCQNQLFLTHDLGLPSEAELANNLYFNFCSYFATFLLSHFCFLDFECLGFSCTQILKAKMLCTHCDRHLAETKLSFSSAQFHPIGLVWPCKLLIASISSICLNILCRVGHGADIHICAITASQPFLWMTTEPINDISQAI